MASGLLVNVQSLCLFVVHTVSLSIMLYLITITRANVYLMH